MEGNAIAYVWLDNIKMYAGFVVWSMAVLQIPCPACGLALATQCPKSASHVMYGCVHAARNVWTIRLAIYCACETF